MPASVMPNPEMLSKPEPAAVMDRFFEVSLLLMLGTGFITLASTGKLDIISVVLLVVALAARLWGRLHRMAQACQIAA